MPRGRRTSKVGLILECGPEGTDRKVCARLAGRIADEANQEIELSFATLNNKKILVAECGAAAARLLGEGCDRVIIVWDLHPPWRDTEPCRREDRENITASLNAADVDLARVHLVCISEELEAWLLADGRALSDFLSTPAHPVHVRDYRWSESVRNPKREVYRLFEGTRWRRYDDIIHADMIIRRLPDLSKIRRCPSFQRFESKLLGRA